MIELKHLYIGLLAGILFLLPLSMPQAKEYPASRDLTETGVSQRRDLSMPGSRIVINFYNFSGKQTAVEYSNRPTFPLNVAYLSTHKNVTDKNPLTRFSRAVSDLLTIRKSNQSSEELALDSTSGLVRSYTTQWLPHCLTFQGEYQDDTFLRGTDFLYDEKTIARMLEVSDTIEGYCFSGSYNGNIRFEDDILIIENNNIRYAINFSIPVLNHTVIKDRWYVKLGNSCLGENKKVVIAVAFADKDESESLLIRRVSTPLLKKDVDSKLNDKEQYWDDFLAKVPRPSRFDLSHINTYGVTAEQLKLAYYKAWVFTAQNILPADGKEFPFPQFCTGKPSLWDEGERRAPFSAAWESFIGMQLYAFINPAVSWEAFKGLMTLVNEDGMLGGESLPSRKAQTALILYKITGDKQALNDVYPALKRYLIWRMNITHWVYMDITPDIHLKDAEFVFSALVDMEHMAEIARILGLKEEKRTWEKRHKLLSKQCIDWFWETPDSLPVQYYNIRSQHRSEGNTIWVTTGLYVNGLLKGKYLKSMMERFYKEYDPDKPFAGFVIPKYPDISYTVYGLLEHGFEEEAICLVEANLRDIVRANTSFAEQYIGENFEPDGVRPSVFGSSTLIDFIWLLNGYKYNRGNLTGEYTIMNLK